MHACSQATTSVRVADAATHVVLALYADNRVIEIVVPMLNTYISVRQAVLATNW